MLMAYRCSLGVSLALLVAAAPASAAVVVTTGETDTSGPVFSVVIVDPLDGAVLEGTPDAVVAVQIEYVNIDGAMVRLNVDDVPAPDDCAEQTSPCSLKVTLTPGMHTLVATGQAFADEPPIESDPVTVEVTEAAATDTGGAPTSSDSGTDGTGSTGSTGSTGDASDPDGDKGCACSTRGGPDLLGLALAALLAPWRRRRAR